MGELKLLKNEKKQEQLIANEQLKSAVVKSIALGECSVPEDLVREFGLTYEQSISLLSDPNFLSTLSMYTKARLSLSFHSLAVGKLQEIIQDDDPKIAIQAIKLSAQLTNNLKGNNTDVNINLNLENLVKETEKNITPFVDIEKVS